MTTIGRSGVVAGVAVAVGLPPAGVASGEAIATAQANYNVYIPGTASGVATVQGVWGARVARSGSAAGTASAMGVGEGPFDVTFLLPRNREPFEIAAGEAMTDELPVPIRVIVDPQQTPPEFLPFLAAHDSVDLWFEDWPLQRKRDMVSEAITLAALKGTRQGSIRFMSYVDATLLGAISYPAPFVMGRAVIGRTPIGHPAFVARYLVKVETYNPPNTFVMGRSVIGRSVLRTPSRDKLNRVLIALRVAKAPETEIRVDFQHKRALDLIDAPLLDDAGTHYVGEFVDHYQL